MPHDNFKQSKLDEKAIEGIAFESLGNLGYVLKWGREIEREAESWVLQDELKKAIKRVNANVLEKIDLGIQDELIKSAIGKINALENPLKTTSLYNQNALYSANEAMQRLYIQGVNVEIYENGESRGLNLGLIDFDCVENNDFVAIRQMSFDFGLGTKRADMVLYVNGLAFALIELKNPLDINATLQSAFDQIETYKAFIATIFITNLFCIISDGFNARVGSVSADFARYSIWRGESKDLQYKSEIEILIDCLLKPKIVLDMLRFFVVFESSKMTDKNGLITSIISKKIAHYHQYYAVNKALISTQNAMNGANANKKGGCVWHTQGSGKSLTMVFYTAKAIAHFDNPTIVIITDRNDLDGQLFGTFLNASKSLRSTPTQAQSTADLKRLLKVQSGGIVFSTIQKFSENSENFELLSARENIIVLCDEAHRTQYGFEAHINESGDLRYGYAKNLRDALPNATYLGFTGTPIEKADADTRAVFGEYVDIYDIKQAVNDGATVKIYYESRLIKLSLSDEGANLLKELDSKALQNDFAQERIKAKSTRLRELIGADNRIKELAGDILEHFGARQKLCKGKAMIAVESREIAVKLYDELIALKPQWHSDLHTKGALKVIITANSDDGVKLAKHHTTKTQRDEIAERFKNIDDELELVIVCDMWLTGFDVPPLHTLYMDKYMHGHNLMQAIARVNRVYKDKSAGLIVDYLGIAGELKSALEFYTQSGGRGQIISNKAELIAKMQEKFEIVSAMLYGVDFMAYFSSDTKGKIRILNQSMEKVLSLENDKPNADKPRQKSCRDGKRRFYDETENLLKAYTMATPSDEARKISREVAFFDLLKRTMIKKLDSAQTLGESSESKNGELITQSIIRQILNNEIISEGIEDILQSCGVNADISILSSEFLERVGAVPQKYLAIATLQKLLNDELRHKMQTHLSAKGIYERLQSSIRSYQNKILSAAEVIEELIALGKEIIAYDNAQKELGLQSYEYAFYSAVSENESAKELLGKDKLKALALAIFTTLKANARLDWQHKEAVRAKLRLAVKKVLKQYGYPPDMQQLATDRVLEQAELIANEITKN